MAIITVIMKPVKGECHYDPLHTSLEDHGAARGHDVYAALQTRNEPRYRPTPAKGYARLDAYAKQAMRDLALPLGGRSRVYERVNRTRNCVADRWRFFVSYTV